MMAYRSSVHSSTGFTPNMMTLGRETLLSLQAVIGLPHENVECTASEYVRNQQSRWKEVHEIARKSLKVKTQYPKRKYDVKAKKTTIPIEMSVLVHDPSRKVGVCPKLTSIWKGPYVVAQKIDDVKNISVKGKSTTADIKGDNNVIFRVTLKDNSWKEPKIFSGLMRRSETAQCDESFEPPSLWNDVDRTTWQGVEMTWRQK